MVGRCTGIEASERLLGRGAKEDHGRGGRGRREGRGVYRSASVAIGEASWLSVTVSYKTPNLQSVLRPHLRCGNRVDPGIASKNHTGCVGYYSSHDYAITMIGRRVGAIAP